MIHIPLIFQALPAEGTGRMAIRSIQNDRLGRFSDDCWEFFQNSFPHEHIYMIPDHEDMAPNAEHYLRASFLRLCDPSAFFSGIQIASSAYDVYMVRPEGEDPIIVGVLYRIPPEKGHLSLLVWGGYDGWFPATLVRVGTSPIALIPRAIDGTGQFQGAFTSCVVQKLVRS